MSRFGIELELEDGVGSTPVVDMRHKSEPVGWVGLHGVGSNGRLTPFDGVSAHRPVIP